MPTLDPAGFTALLQRLADAWGRQDTPAALACFAPDAVYIEPPDVQLFVGHAQLGPYFGALTPGTYLRFHHLWFDAGAQTGAAEFSFGVAGRPTADHGMVSLELRGRLIGVWREYPRKGPADFALFSAAAGKQWQWHIGNYP
jgi:hypothetical protein